MQTAIRVENLSKQYRINHAVAGRHNYRTLRESVAGIIMAPFNRWKSNAAARADDFWALKDVGFEVQAGEVVGIIGRNGAGKSTLLKILSRITKPTEGHVSLHGRVGSLLEVGTGFHPELTGRENVYLNGSILGMSRAEIDRQFDAIVDFSGVEKFLDTPVKRYSSGMQVRLAFAVAAYLDPELMLVDEVLAVGDATYQRKCIERMSELARSGRTILFVSHNMELIPRLCSRAVLLDRGSVACDADARSVTDRYISNIMDSDNEDNLETKRHCGDGRARFVLLQHVDESGRPLHSHRSGDDLIFRMEIESTYEIPRCALGVVLETLYGSCLVTGWTEEVEFYPRLHMGRSTYECRFRNVRLRPGQRLNVSLWLASHGETIDWVPNVRLLEISHGDDTEGVSAEHNHGIVLYEQSWRQVA